MVERKVPETMYGKIRTIIDDSGIEGEFSDWFLVECAAMATWYENMIISMENKWLPIKSIFKSKTKRFRNLKWFGRISAVIKKIRLNPN
jgi:hypothetical protein